MTISLDTIRKQTLQFQYNGNADGFALQKEVGDWCNFNLIPAIEQQLELLDLGDNYFTIDQLEIEATGNKNDWQQKIRDELIFCLKQKLSYYKPKFAEVAGSKSLTRARKLDELILYYFENGYLPWWGKTLIADDFDTVLQNWIREEMFPARADFILKELKEKASKNLFERILNQLPVELFFQLLKNIRKQESAIISYAESFFEEVTLNQTVVAEQKAFTKAVSGFVLAMMIENEGHIDIDLLVRFIYEEVKKTNTSFKVLEPAIKKNGKIENPVKEAWQKLLLNELIRSESGNEKQQLSVNEIKSTTELNLEAKEINAIAENDKRLQYNKLIDRLVNPDSSKNRKDTLVSELREGIFIDNAGAVIFAAFIPALFRKLELEKNGAIQNPDLAAMIIQYCVSGHSKITEYELVLPKILCGIDIELPVKTNIRITDNQMKEVDEMLLALIEHWSVLKDTSIDGLRESFFKRSGKLSMTDNEWLLQVAQRPYDMLLQQLPWSISMIKLPWMTNLIKTEWV
jgi:hypothetical protein